MAKRRPSGDGCVRKRADGRWEGRIVVGHKSDGRPIYKTALARTQKELLPKLHSLIETYQGMEMSEDSQMTLNQWMDQWMQSYAVPSLRPGTVIGYQNDIRNYIAPALGHRKIQQLTTAEIQHFYNSLSHRLCKKPRNGEDRLLSPASVRKVHGLLHEILGAAVQARLRPDNPTEGTTVPRLEQQPKLVLDDAQLEIFKKAIQEEPQWYDFFYTELTTGLRRGEICGLRWKDLSISTGKLHICRQAGRVEGKVQTFPLKPNLPIGWYSCRLR